MYGACGAELLLREGGSEPDVTLIWAPRLPGVSGKSTEIECALLGRSQESSSSEVGSAAQDIEVQIKAREDPGLDV